MNLDILREAVIRFQADLFSAITTSSYGGKEYPNGQKAKEALIRSQTLIMNIHESVKQSFWQIITTKTQYEWRVFPPLNCNKPELKIYGLLKAKDQDLVFLRSSMNPNPLKAGPNAETIDEVGEDTTSKAIIIGIRSQMSSVDKNFDTLMERAFAETLNLRLRIPILTMGEVYLLPLHELDDQAMINNEIRFKRKQVNINKYIKTFDAFSGRSNLMTEEQYKYDASALILVDFKKTPAEIITSSDDLAKYGYSGEILQTFDNICASNFDTRLLNNYLKFQNQVGL